MLKRVLFWLIAFLITILTAYYQRLSGPYNTKYCNAVLNGKTWEVQLPRKGISGNNCEIKIKIPDQNITGELIYKRFPTDDMWDTIEMVNINRELKAYLPSQPPAGKLIYFIRLNSGNNTWMLAENDWPVLRFRGDVPALIMIPHIFLMFLAMLFSNFAGLSAVFRLSAVRFYTFATFLVLFAGGMVFGPIMQKFAFGEFWTGFPFGLDLTDNKTLIAVLAWIIAVIANIRKTRYGWIIFAAVITLIIFLIPHSMFGSELNYSSGNVTSG